MGFAGRVALLCLGGVIGILVSRLARGDEPKATCAVRIIHAAHEGEGIDPKITRLRPYLQRRPFKDWSSFQLLDERDLQIAPHSTESFPLPNGRHGSLTYMDHHLRPDGKHRLRLQLGITDGGQKVLHTQYTLDEGGIILYAGQKYQNGILVLGVSCETPHG